jgi:hypothetical protein
LQTLSAEGKEKGSSAPAKEKEALESLLFRA